MNTAAEELQPAGGAPEPPGRGRSWVRALAPVLVILAILLAFLLGLSLGSGGGGGAHEHAEGAAAPGSVWTCSMHPQIQRGEPGECPICGMALVPVSAGGAGAAPASDQVVLSPQALANARVRAVPVGRASQQALEVRLPGRLEVDETRTAVVTSWVDGRIDRLLTETTGQVVRRGQVVAQLYSPEVYAAHQELLASRRQVERLGADQEFAARAGRDSLRAARQRLSLLGIPDAELDQMEAAQAPWRQVRVRAVAGGTVLERSVVEGSWVKAGMPLLRVADLSRLWLQLDAWERDLPNLAPGQRVEVTFEALPGEVFEGQVAFLDPTLNPKTRTVRVRVEVDNADGRLRPGMFAEATVRADALAAAQRPLVVPATAPLFSGRRSIVYVEVPDQPSPTFEAREVRLGARLGDVYPVMAGLDEGEWVVVEGAFRLDADLQIRGGASLMQRPDDRAPGAWDAVIEEPVPEAFRRGLEELLLAYLELQAALADDDLAAAHSRAERLRLAAQGLTLEGGGPAAQLWSQLRPTLSQDAEQLRAARTLDGARVAFEPLSTGVEGVLRAYGNPTGEVLRVASCPMAFNNRGARWVQRGDTLTNAYFGAAMPRCGELKARIEPGSRLAAPQAEPTSGPASGPTSGPASMPAGHVH